MDLVRNTYPHSAIDIKDESAGTRTSTVSMPLHRPLVFIRAAQGDDKLEWLTASEAIKKYGEQTFDQFEKYYGNEQLLLDRAILPNQGAYIKRLIPDDAATATIAIEAHVTTDVDVPQYRRDEDGKLIIDAETGEPTPEVDGSNTPVTRKGVKIKFVSRALTAEEFEAGYKNLNVRTVNTGAGTSTAKVYPIVAATFTSACERGNDFGFKLYIDMNKQSSDIQEVSHALLWTFIPMEQPYNSNTAYPIKDKFGTQLSQMVMRPNQTDPNTQMRISAEDTIQRLFYNEYDGRNLLPFNIHFFSNFIEEVGDIIRGYETDDPTLENGWMVNILSLTDTEGNPYKCAVFDDEDLEAISLSPIHINYMRGGSDGNISDEWFEATMREYLKLNIDPELADRFHYKITHIYDVGYSIETKMAIIDFMAAQLRCKAILAAQDSNRHLYSMDEATSLAAALKARCLITPESELYNTPAMRATIFAQSGYLNDLNIKDIVPMTIWQAQRRSSYHGTNTIAGSWAASPANEVTMYKEINFIPYNADQKQLLWDGCANYIQYKDGKKFFAPAIRSIYSDATSLLADDEFTDACIYLMYIVDDAWTEHVSRKLPFATLAETIRGEIDDRAYKAFGSYYTVSSNVYLSEEDKANHDTLSIDVTITGDYPKRVWNTTIIARGRSES